MCVRPSRKMNSLFRYTFTTSRQEVWLVFCEGCGTFFQLEAVNIHISESLQRDVLPRITIALQSLCHNVYLNALAVPETGNLRLFLQTFFCVNSSKNLIYLHPCCVFRRKHIGSVRFFSVSQTAQNNKFCKEEEFQIYNTWKSCDRKRAMLSLYKCQFAACCGNYWISSGSTILLFIHLLSQLQFMYKLTLK